MTNKYIQNTDYFNVIDTEEKSYWLGFLYADGCISERKKNDKVKSINLELTLCEKDISHLYKFLKAIDSTCEPKRKVIKLNGNEYVAYRVNIYDTIFCKNLIKAGCVPNKTYNLELPNNDIVPEQFMKHFIRGMIDGDGCIYVNEENNSYKCGITGTKEIILGIQKHLLNNFIPAYITWLDIEKSSPSGFFCGKDTFVDIFNYLYKDSKISLDRKFEKFNNAIMYINNNYKNWSGKNGVSKSKRRENYWIVSYNNYINDNKLNQKTFRNFEEAVNFRKSYEIERIKYEQCPLG